MKRGYRIIIWLAGGAFLLCILAAGISALSNLFLPQGPQRLDQLDALDKARLAETLHLKKALGETIWPGFGEADIPVLLWNRAYSFLIGFSDSPDGWAEVPEDTFAGRPYYRQQTKDPQNFAVLIDASWVASMSTKHEADLFFREKLQEGLPPVVKQVFPYRVLIFPSETQIAAVLHESFHAYQAVVAPEPFAAADQVYGKAERYWAADEAMGEAWTAEIELLIQATQARTDAEAAELARQFLSQRAQRRAGLDADLLDYERKMEWLEGLAKYVEVESWRRASESADYKPLEEMSADPDFRHYTGFAQHSRQELNQLRRQATRQGDVRFYYTGWVQGLLLDRLMPEWKDRVLGVGVYLEDLLWEAAGE